MDGIKGGRKVIEANLHDTQTNINVNKYYKYNFIYQLTDHLLPYDRVQDTR